MQLGKVNLYTQEQSPIFIEGIEYYMKKFYRIQVSFFLIIIIFLFVSCQSKDDLFSNHEKSTSLYKDSYSLKDRDTKHEQQAIFNDKKNCIIIENEVIYLNQFSDNNLLTKEENEQIKRSIIEIIFFTYGYDFESNILSLIDEQRNIGLLPIDDLIKDKTFFDTLNEMRSAHINDGYDFKISSIDTNFMQSFFEDEKTKRISIEVTVYHYMEALGELEGGSSCVYWFDLFKIDNVYKIIELGLDA